MANSVICLTSIDVTVDPPTCLTGWQAVETSLGFDVSQLDPASVLQAFSAGAMIVFAPLAIVWACKVVIDLLR